jgi:hypothetical protein
MSLSSTGITQDVIREMMPPYHLSPDLLEAMFAALPPPPPDAPTPWRQARITRLMQEISTLMPANAAQARLASQIVIVREMADTIAARAYAPELTVAQMCRIGRASAELVRTAAGVERLLARQQQKPVPFFGTVLADEVDVAAVDAAWGKATAGADAMPRPGPGVDDAEPATRPRQGALGEEVGNADDSGAAQGLTAGIAVEGRAGTAPGISAPPGRASGQTPGGKAHRWQVLAGQGLPATTGEKSAAITATHQSAMEPTGIPEPVRRTERGVMKNPDTTPCNSLRGGRRVVPGERRDQCCPGEGRSGWRRRRVNLPDIAAMRSGESAQRPHGEGDAAEVSAECAEPATTL